MILGVIPARGGSKGVPRKNIRIIAGKPLIAWTIEAAQRSKLLERFVVSTEDAEIATIARQYGAEVLDRPAELATDTALMIDVVKHVISVIPADVVVILQPTSPIRDPGLIDECIKNFIQQGVDNYVTGFYCKHVEYCKTRARRQDIKGFFCNDGNVHIVKRSLIELGTLRREGYGKLETSREQNIEIDDEFDFWVAEQVLLKRIKENRQ